MGPSNDMYPANLPVIPICLDRNTEFSNEEEYLFLFLHCVQTGLTDLEDHVVRYIRRA